MANSNAIAQVTIFDQDLLSPGLSNLVQRLAATVTLAVPNALLYSGYLTVSSTSFVNLLPAGAVCPFAYVRNASPGTVTNNPLVLNLQQTGGVSTIAMNLFNSGIFIFANSSVISSPPSTLQTLSYASFVSSPVVMEYMIAY